MRFFWWLLARAVRRGTAAIPRAVMFAIVGESLIRYTEEVVLPWIDPSLADLASATERWEHLGARQGAAPKDRVSDGPSAGSSAHP